MKRTFKRKRKIMKLNWAKSDLARFKEQFWNHSKHQFLTGSRCDGILWSKRHPSHRKAGKTVYYILNLNQHQLRNPDFYDFNSIHTVFKRKQKITTLTSTLSNVSSWMHVLPSNFTLHDFFQTLKTKTQFTRQTENSRRKFC